MGKLALIFILSGLHALAADEIYTEAYAKPKLPSSIRLKVQDFRIENENDLCKAPDLKLNQICSSMGGKCFDPEEDLSAASGSSTDGGNSVYRWVSGVQCVSAMRYVGEVECYCSSSMPGKGEMKAHREGKDSKQIAAYANLEIPGLKSLKCVDAHQGVPTLEVGLMGGVQMRVELFESGTLKSVRHSKFEGQAKTYEFKDPNPGFGNNGLPQFIRMKDQKTTDNRLTAMQALIGDDRFKDERMLDKIYACCEFDLCAKKYRNGTDINSTPARGTPATVQ